MKTYLLDSFRGGISDYEDKGISGAFKYGTNLNIRRKQDSLYANQALIEESSVTFTALLNVIINASDGNSYGFSNDGKIYKRTSGATWSLVYTDANGAILGAKEWACSNGKKYIFWATATRLNCKEIAGQANWSDANANVVVGGTTYTYPKTNLTSATWHTMEEAVGALMIANGNTLAMVGYDGSYSTNVLQLIPNNNAKAIIERGNYVVVGATRTDTSEQSMLFSWDSSSSSWNDKRILPVGSLNALIDTELPLMQIGSNGQLFYADLNNILPITQFPLGGSVYPTGVDNDSGLAVFGVSGNGAGYSGIYSYGRKYKNHPFVLNCEYQLDVDTIGAVKKVGTDIVFSCKIGAAYKVYRVNTVLKATATYESLDLKAPLDPSNPLAREVVWDMVVLQTAPLPASCAIEVYYKINKTGSWVQAKMEGNITQFTTTNGTEAIFLIGEKGQYCEVKIKLIPSLNYSPEVYKAKLLFT